MVPFWRMLCHPALLTIQPLPFPWITIMSLYCYVPLVVHKRKASCKTYWTWMFCRCFWFVELAKVNNSYWIRNKKKTKQNCFYRKRVTAKPYLHVFKNILFHLHMVAKMYFIPLAPLILSLFKLWPVFWTCVQLPSLVSNCCVCCEAADLNGRIYYNRFSLPL